MRAYDYRARARFALQGKWAMTVPVTFVGMLLGAGTGFGNNIITFSGGSAAGNATSNSVTQSFDFTIPGTSCTVRLDFPFLRLIFPVLAFFFVLASFYSIVVFLIGGAADLGLKNYNIRMLREGTQPPFGMLFSRFAIFGRALLLQLAMALFIFLWSLLFIIPGIVASYRYAMAPYLMAENPELGVLEAINLSKQMTFGHKGRLFFLHLSFIGWEFLAALTFGIGHLWLNPYKRAAEASFYLDLQRITQSANNGQPSYNNYQQPGNPPQA